MAKRKNKSARVSFSKWDTEEKKIQRPIAEKIEIMNRKLKTTREKNQQNIHEKCVPFRITLQSEPELCKDTGENLINIKTKVWQNVVESFTTLNKRNGTLMQVIAQWRITKYLFKKKNPKYTQSQRTTTRDLLSPEVKLNNIQFTKKIDDNKTPFDRNTLKVKEETKIKKSNSFSCPIENTFRCNQLDMRNNLETGMSDMQKDDYKSQLFVLEKKEKEKAISYSAEEHEMRMDILAIERQYWQAKLNNEKGPADQAVHFKDSTHPVTTIGLNDLSKDGVSTHMLCINIK